MPVESPAPNVSTPTQPCGSHAHAEACFYAVTPVQTGIQKQSNGCSHPFPFKGEVNLSSVKLQTAHEDVGFIFHFSFFIFHFSFFINITHPPSDKYFVYKKQNIASTKQNSFNSTIVSMPFSDFAL